MGSFIVQQPNGLFCRFSTTTDCPTHWNMTEKDYVKMMVDEAKQEAFNTLMMARTKMFNNFNDVIDCFIPNNMTPERFETILIEMGYNPKEK